MLVSRNFRLRFWFEELSSIQTILFSGKTNGINTQKAIGYSLQQKNWIFLCNFQATA
jgi:hypothetical protein